MENRTGVRARTSRWVSAAALGTVLAACGNTAPDAAGPLVVASTPILGDVASSVVGDEARIVADIMPDQSVPATVIFVSPQAQFTPKQVETLSERESLMFRIRVRVPPELVEARMDQVKTGVRGVVWVRLADADGRLPDWPEGLTPSLIDLPTTAGADTP